MGPSSRATRTTPRRTISSTMAQSQVLRTLAILLQRISLCPFRNLQAWDCWREAPMGCQYGGGKKGHQLRAIGIEGSGFCAVAHADGYAITCLTSLNLPPRGCAPLPCEL